MKYYTHSKTLKNNWYLYPMVGIPRIKFVKNEMGIEECLPITGLDNRKTLALFLPDNPVDLLPYIKTRCMTTGNYNTTTVLVEKSLLHAQVFTKIKNPYIAFEEAIRYSMPVLGVKLISKNISTKKYDVAALKESYATSLICKWLVETIRTSTRNLPFRGSRALGNELVHLLTTAASTNTETTNSILLKKRTVFYTDLWNLYNIKEEEGQTAQ